MSTNTQNALSPIKTATMQIVTGVTRNRALALADTLVKHPGMEGLLTAVDPGDIKAINLILRNLVATAMAAAYQECKDIAQNIAADEDRRAGYVGQPGQFRFATAETAATIAATIDDAGKLFNDVALGANFALDYAMELAN